MTIAADAGIADAVSSDTAREPRSKQERSTTPAMQRADGRLVLHFEQCDDRGVSALSRLYQRAPCRVLFPAGEGEDIPQAVVLTTSGGLTGGDRLALDLSVGPKAAACITTQAAEKLYRTRPDEVPAEVTVQLSVAGDGWMEWLAQETILFRDSRLRRRQTIDLAGSARFLAADAIVLGRAQMGESYDGFLHDAWQLRRDGRLLWEDALYWEDFSVERTSPFCFADARALGLVLYAGKESTQLLAKARALLDGARATGAAGVIGDLLIVRLLSADAAALRAVTARLVAMIRCEAGGHAERVPRVWTC